MKLSARSYLSTVFVTAIASLSLIGWFNYKVDPGNIFKPGIEKDIAAILLSSKNVANVSNFDDRLLQSYYLDGERVAHQVVAFGSSRSLRINERLFPRETFFNHGVVNATLEDFMAIYEMMRTRDLKPNVLVLGLEPYMLNRSNSKYGWKKIKGPFFESAKRLGVVPNFQMDVMFESASSNKYLQLISLAYLKRSCAELSEEKKRLDFYATDETEGVEASKLKDGSRVYPERYRRRSSAEILQLAVHDASEHPLVGLGGYAQMDPVIKAALESFVDGLQKDHVEPVFFLPPYHPKMYEVLMGAQQYRIVNDVEKYYRELASRKNIKVYGSFDPARTNCDAGEFYDGIHPADACLEKIFR